MPSYAIYSLQDAYIQSGNATYATARAGSGLIYSGGTSGITFGQWLSAPNYYCYEGFIEFNTSGVEGAFVSATLNVNTLIYNATRTAEIRERAWLASTAAWVAGDSLTSYPLLGSASITATGAKAIDLSSIGRATSYGLMINDNYHQSAFAPTADEKNSFSSTIGSFDPYLSIVTSAVTTAFAAIMS